MARFIYYYEMTRVNKTMWPKINDSLRQMNTFSVDTQGYIASISFSNEDITNIYKCTVFISYLLK